LRPAVPWWATSATTQSGQIGLKLTLRVADTTHVPIR
jgi:hypothetical protein